MQALDLYIRKDVNEYFELDSQEGKNYINNLKTQFHENQVKKKKELEEKALLTGWNDVDLMLMESTIFITFTKKNDLLHVDLHFQSLNDNGLKINISIFVRTTNKMYNYTITKNSTVYTIKADDLFFDMYKNHQVKDKIKELVEIFKEEIEKDKYKSIQCYDLVNKIEECLGNLNTS